MYKVLDYGSTLGLRDRDGKRATFRKREKVRYFQDHIIAYQDKAAILAQIHTQLAQLEEGWKKKCPFRGIWVTELTEAGVDGSRTHQGLFCTTPQTVLKTARDTGRVPPPT
jgi:hypothetical protein